MANTAAQTYVGATGPAGPSGATGGTGGTGAAGGSGSIVLSAQSVLETGISNQRRAGRVLTLADFTTLLGLSAPVGLYNLTTTADSSGNSRTLTNKGTVTFGSGITGAATEAAIFTGNVNQAFYIADTGASDPFRIKYGSVGCWFKTAKRSTDQCLVTKYGAGGTRVFLFYIASGANAVYCSWSCDGSPTAVATNGVTDVCDNRWHFAVVTYDGNTAACYVDGVLEASNNITGAGPLFGGTAPFNIGGYQADSVTNASTPMYGSIDEAFITADVLTADQVRLLYAASFSHGYATTPTAFTLNVRRRKKGGTLSTANFSTTPLHLYNFTAGVLTDAGSLGTTLTNNGTTLAAAGADGATGNAFNFVSASTQYLSATDTGLPSGTSARSFGCWLKTITSGSQAVLVSWGTVGAATEIFLNVASTGVIAVNDNSTTLTGTSVNDGQWHWAVAVQDNSALDGLKTKIYVDGKLVASSTSLLGASLTLAGANAFRVGRDTGAATAYFNGQIDSAFITNYAMTSDEVANLYAVGSLALSPSPKNAGDHIEGVDATNLYVVMDTLESQHQVDLLVFG